MNHKEAIEFIRSFLKSVDTEDNMATARPLLHCLQVRERVYGTDLNCSDGTVYCYKGMDTYVCESLDELQTDLLSNGYTVDDLDDIFVNEKYQTYDYQNMWVTKQTFLSEESFNEHIRLNKHNIPHPYRRYVQHAFRDPVLVDLYKAMRVVVDETEMKGFFKVKLSDISEELKKIYATEKDEVYIPKVTVVEEDKCQKLKLN